MCKAYYLEVNVVNVTVNVPVTELGCTVSLQRGHTLVVMCWQAAAILQHVGSQWNDFFRSHTLGAHLHRGQWLKVRTHNCRELPLDLMSQPDYPSSNSPPLCMLLHCTLEQYFGGYLRTVPRKINDLK